MKSLLTVITDFVFGTKYYAIIVNTKGTDKCEISSFIFHTKSDAKRKVQELSDNRSYLYVETITFRSRKEYKINY